MDDRACRPPRLYHRSLHDLLSETKISVVSDAPFARDYSFRIPAASIPNGARLAVRIQILFALFHELDIFIGSTKTPSHVQLTDQFHDR